MTLTQLISDTLEKGGAIVLAEDVSTDERTAATYTGRFALDRNGKAWVRISPETFAEMKRAYAVARMAGI